MQDLLVVVEAVDADLVFLALGGSADLAGSEDRLGLGNLTGGFQGHLLLGGAVKHPEEVVVGAGHDRRIGAVPAALKLVEDAVVLVQ